MTHPAHMSGAALTAAALAKATMQVSDKIGALVQDEEQGKAISEQLVDAANTGVPIDWSRIDPTLIVAVVKVSKP